MDGVTTIDFITYDLCCNDLRNNYSKVKEMMGLYGKIVKTVRCFLWKALLHLRQWRFSLLPVKLYAPIFIVGCSRAGTTLVYKTFSESRQLGSLQKETHEFWSGLHPPETRAWASHEIPAGQACDADRQQASRLFYSGADKAPIVDKNNQNGLSIPYLYTLFPSAHFVFIKRSPGDNIESLIKGWGKASEFGTWSDDLPEEVIVDDGAYQNWCFFLTKGWQKYCRSTIEEVCAFQYESINRAILNARKQIPEKQWHEVSYEALLANPVNEFRRLFKSCELNFTPVVQKHCEEGLDKPYNTFSAIGVDKWKEGDNRQRIERALESLGSITSDLGY